jgi:CBS domain-containing protein
MSEKLVRDVMVSLEEYPCISDTCTLAEAIDQMRKATILRKERASLPRVALVFDDGFNDLLGVLRRRDIMRGLAPRFLASGALDYRKKLFDVKLDPNLPELSFDTRIARICERSGRLVREFMMPIKITIDGSDHIMKAVHTMVEQNVSLIPVLDGNRVVGVVRSVDVLRELCLIINS